MAETLHSSRSGGRIITQNPDLFSLLTERTKEGGDTSSMDQNDEDGADQFQKIYVDSPAFEDEDDEKYKYVSTNVDDFDENQLKAFMMDPDPLDQLVEETAPKIKDRSNLGKAGSGRVSQRYNQNPTPNAFSGLTQHEDEDEELRKEQEYQDNLLKRIKEQKNEAENFEIPKLNLSDDEDNPRDSLDPSLSAGGGKFHEINLRDSLEIEEMQKAKDQERLRRILDDNEDPSGFNALIGDNLEYKTPQQQTVGGTVGAKPYQENVYDSQRYYDPQGQIHGPGEEAIPQFDDQRLKQVFSVAQPQVGGGPPPQGLPVGSYQGYTHQDQGPYAGYSNQYRAQPRPEPGIEHHAPYGPPLEPQYQQFPPENRLYEQQQEYYYQEMMGHQAAPPSHQHPSHLVHPAAHQHMVHPAAHQHPAQMVHPAAHQHPGHMVHPTGPQTMHQHPAPHMVHPGPQTMHQHPAHLVHPGPQDHMHQYQHQWPQHNNQFADQTPLYQQPPPNVIPGYTFNDFDQESRGSSPADSETSNKEPGKPKIDFISRNKKDFARTVPQAMNSYSNSYSERKKKKENIPPSPKLGKNRGPVKATHPKPVNSENSGTFIVDEVEKPRTAETVWSKRTQSLKAVRTEKTGKPKRNPLRKFPSESRVDDMKQTVSSAPPKLQPIKGTPRQAFTEPIRTELEVDPLQLGKGPLRHAVYTDDGQRVSVDINLKLVQPVPYYGAFNQQQQQPYSGAVAGAPLSQRPPLPTNNHDNRYPDNYTYQPALPPPHVHQPPQPQDSFNGYNYSQAPHASDRTTPMSQRSNYTPVGGSPFKVLPPIQDSHQPRDRSTSQASETGTYRQVSPRRMRAAERREEEQLPPKDDTSYLEQMRRAKARKPVEFRRYTVEDYKKLKREVRLGGLGPDLDNESLRDKRDKREKQREYAQKVKSKNKQDFEKELQRPSARPEPEDDPRDDMLHRRNIALEYAKSVPKPKVRPPPGSYPSPTRTPVVQTLQVPAAPPPAPKGKKQVRLADEDLLDLASLRQRHEEEKQKAALIRQQIEAGQ